jgi:plastocyanin
MTNSRRAAAAAIAAFGAVAAIALGPVAAADDGPAASASAARAKVKIKGFKYRPAALRVRRGTRVVFVNRDRAPHTATRRGSFSTGTLRRGQRAAVRFRKRGTYRYLCTIHPYMRGKIVVR